MITYTHYYALAHRCY